MHLLFSGALSLAIWGWWAISPLMFYGGVFLSIFLMMYIDISNSIAKNGFLDSAISIMTRTDCCLVELWANPTSVRWTTVAFKIIAGLAALCATDVSWQHRRSFIDGHYTLVSAVWATAAVLWLCSCIPMLVCLVQCAANSKLKLNGNLKINGNELILRFRKVYALWVLHDMVLGVFWLYLSTMLFDLADDMDDSEWRTIFLSMLSWHIVIILLSSVYFEPLANIHPIVTSTTTPTSQTTPCCSQKKAKSLWCAMLILAYAGMYIVIILRTQQDALLDLGFDSVLYPIGFSCAATLYGTSRMYIDHLTHKDTHISMNAKLKYGTSRMYIDHLTHKDTHTPMNAKLKNGTGISALDF